MITMLDKLQALVSRQFVVGYFIPVLVFLFINGLLLGWQLPAAAAWIPAQFGGLKGFYAIPVLIGVAVVAYVFSTVNVYLRQVLEGRRLPALVRDPWIERQQEILTTKTKRLREARTERFELQRQKPIWRTRLRTASDKGNASPVAGATYDAKAPAAQAIDALEAKRASVRLIKSAEIAAAVAGLEAVLTRIDRRANAALQTDYSALLAILDYAEDAADIEFSNAIGDIERNFGEAVQPTRMGNVAAALDQYGNSRYSMNLAVFWSRMQVVIQDKKELYGSLLDAKCQLDFLVMCCWLCLLTSVGWLIGVQWLAFSAWFYVVLLVVIPVVARVFYELALENYLALADLIRSIVDLHRFQLLKSLHVAPPRGIREERAMWSALGQLASGSTGVEISYQHDGP